MGDIVELWPEQCAALDGLRGSLRAGRKRPVLELPTGSGKTVIAAKIVDGARRKAKQVAMTVPLINLIDQTYERFVSYGVDPFDIGVIQADHPLTAPAAPVQICSVQTLAARKSWPDADVVIADEAHLQHKVIYRWMEARPDAVFVGLSATPWARGLGDWYDDLVRPASMRELIAAKRLSPLCAFAPARVDLSDVAVVAGEYHEGQLSTKMRGVEITADVVRTWCDKGEGRPSLVFAVDCAHAAVLAERFKSVGVPTAYVDGDTEMVDRHKMVAAFHRGEIKVICSIGTMNAGIDIDVRCVVFARPTKSEILYVQSVGRGMRWKDGKDHLLLLDHSNCSLEMGLPMDIRFERLLPARAGNNVERMLGERTAKKPKECPRCKRLNEHKAKTCEGCGHEFKITTSVREVDGHLRQMSFDGCAPPPRDGRRTWDRRAQVVFMGELKAVCAARGYKSGWAWMKFKDRFGQLSLEDAGLRRLLWNVPPQPVSMETASWLRSQQIRWAKRQEKVSGRGSVEAGAAEGVGSGLAPEPARSAV